MNPVNALQLDGATRLIYIVGDPIAQVKSPSGVSQSLQAAGRNALCVPVHVTGEDLQAWAEGARVSRNVDGIIVTVPHKFACRGLCSTVSERADFLGAVNTLRRAADGRWHGDMFDGMGYVRAMQAQGSDPAGRRVLLVGAGGAGSAIAHALITAGVSELAIHDADLKRRDALIGRLQGLRLGRVRVGTSDPRGFDMALNATPIGMAEGDPPPLDVSGLHGGMLVGCVITAPAVPPLIAAARALGCITVTGADMFAQVRELMVDFLLAPA